MIHFINSLHPSFGLKCPAKWFTELSKLKMAYYQVVNYEPYRWQMHDVLMQWNNHQHLPLLCALYNQHSHLMFDTIARKSTGRQLVCTLIMIISLQYIIFINQDSLPSNEIVWHVLEKYHTSTKSMFTMIQQNMKEPSITNFGNILYLLIQETTITYPWLTETFKYFSFTWFLIIFTFDKQYW